jgi:hypothetical protein
VTVTPAGAAAPATFSGSVTKAGPSPGVRAINRQDRAVTGGPGLVVIRDGQPATIADLRAGDRVNVTAGPDGVATRIEASSTAPGVAPAAGVTFTGEATRAGAAGAPLAVRIDGQDRSFPPAPGVIVIRDGKDAAPGDIEAGDMVVVTTNPDGTAARIDATSKPNPLGFLRWLLPLLLLLALLGLLLFFAGRRRRRDSFILEPDTAAGPTTARAATTVEVTTVERARPDRSRR